jgi:hypothetical protein
MSVRKSYFVFLISIMVVVVAAIYLQNGWIALFIDPRAIGLIVIGMILSYRLSGRNGIASAAVFDSLSRDLRADRLQRYLAGRDLLNRSGKHMFIWGSAGTLVALISLFGNIENIRAIAVSVALSLIIPWWIVFLRLIVHYPMLLAHEAAIAAATSTQSLEAATNGQGRAGNIMRIIALIGLFPLIVFLLHLEGIVVSQFLNAGSLLLAVTLPFAVGAAGLGAKTLFRLIGEHVLGSTGNADRVKYRNAIIRIMRRLTLEIGALAVVSTQIIMLGSIGDSAEVMMRQAMSLSGLLYVLILAGALFPSFGETAAE